MVALARIGGVLTILGVVALALFGIRGILGVADMMPIDADPTLVGFASMTLLCIGAAAIGLDAHGALATTGARSGLFLFALGCSSIVSVVLAAAQEDVPGSLGVGSGLIVLAAAGLLAPVGLLVLGVSLVRSTGMARAVGLLICAGGGLAVLGLFSSTVLGYDVSRAVLVSGASIVGAGLVGVGLLAGKVGRPPSGADVEAPPTRLA